MEPNKNFEDLYWQTYDWLSLVKMFVLRNQIAFSQTKAKPFLAQKKGNKRQLTIIWNMVLV